MQCSCPPLLPPSQSGPGCFAYADMLEIGAPALGDPSIPNDCPGQARLSPDEARGSFGAWAVISSPLVLSYDLGNLTEYDAWWPVVSNTRAIAVQQAWAGSPGALVAQSNASYTALTYHGSACEVSYNRSMPFWTAWAKPLSGGAVAAIALNSAAEPVDVDVPLTALGFSGGVTVAAVDVWTGEAAGNLTGSWVIPGLPSHGSQFLILTPLGGTEATSSST